MQLGESADDKVRIARGCWLPRGAADDLAARCAAAISTCADDTVVSGLTAAALHGLWLPAPVEEVHLATARPELAARAMTRTRRPQFRAHRHQLTEQDRVVVRGVPAMSIARTWIDLGRTLGHADLVAAGDSALRGGCSADGLAGAVERSRHVPGVRRARAARLLLDERSRSRPESHLRLATHAPDLPLFEVNETIYREEDGGWLAEPDLSLAEAKIALEYQGEVHAEVNRMRRDITRSADLRREGWVCLLYGPAEVFGRPWQIAPELRTLIHERAPWLIGRNRWSPSRRMVS
jgi:hypothetical protein